MADISLCMIVKNEEKTLPRCLESLKGIPDEIVVVDTGSTDGTKRLAREYTDKVFDFAWTDDFAAARNFSLSKAGCDYVYVADADEVLDEENHGLFLQLKAALLPEVEVVEMAYAQMGARSSTENFRLEYRPKLFRRLRAFQFADPIHEALRTDPVVYRSNVVVQHWPRGDHGGRDLAHFARLVAKGERFSNRLEMMYARELLLAGTRQDFRTARPYFQQVHGDGERSTEALRRAACVLAQRAALDGDTEELMRVAAPELVGSPPSEICCAMGEYYLARREDTQAADWFSAALSGAAPELVAASAGSLPLKGMAACYEMTGDYESAQTLWDRAKAWEEENLGGGV